MKTKEQLQDDLKHYQEVYKAVKARRDLRGMEGVQQNIDRTYDELHKMRGIKQ